MHGWDGFLPATKVGSDFPGIPELGYPTDVDFDFDTDSRVVNIRKWDLYTDDLSQFVWGLEPITFSLNPWPDAPRGVGMTGPVTLTDNLGVQHTGTAFVSDFPFQPSFSTSAAFDVIFDSRIDIDAPMMSEAPFLTNYWIRRIDASVPIPEPSTVLLIALGLIFLLVRRMP